MNVWTCETHGEEVDYNPGLVSVWTTAEAAMQVAEVYYRSTIAVGDDEYHGIEWVHTVDGDVDWWEGHVLDWDEYIVITRQEVRA